MNLTPLQERRLQQVKHEISFLEKQTKKKGIGFAIWFSLVCMIAGYVVSYLIELLVNHKTLSAFIREESWLRFLRNWIIWLLATYFFIVRGNYQALKMKRKELADLQKKYGLTEKATS